MEMQTIIDIKNVNLQNIDQVAEERNLDERQKIDLLNEVIFEMRDEKVKESIELSKQILNNCDPLSDGTTYDKGIAYAHANIGFKSVIIGNMEEGFESLQNALSFFKKTEDEDGKAFVNVTMGNYYWGKGDYNTAMDLVFESLRNIEKLINPTYKGWVLFFVANFYNDLKNNELSIEYFNKAAEQFRLINYPVGLARTLNGVTNVYRRIKDYEKALEHAYAALDLHSKVGSIMGIARSYNDIGSINADKGDFDKAIEFLDKSLAIRKKTHNKQATITTLTELGEAYSQVKRYEQAADYLSEAKSLAKEIDAKAKLVRINLSISHVFKSSGDFLKALEFHEEAFSLKSEILESDAENKVKNVEARFLADKKEKEAEIHRLKNVELKNAYEQIEEKNKNITDSIFYAQRIQQAILPKQEILNQLFPEHFIFYQPKDIVSGDFYWAACKGDKKIFAAVDCTGHGVPGAFMSMIGNALLNEIVNEKGITDPSEILNQLRQGVIKALKQTGAECESKDGMDIALVALKKNDNGKTILQFAGANNPLWILKAANKTNPAELIELPANKFPIGIHLGIEKPYNEQELELSTGDICYIFTDGYADQFGGPNGKKLKYKAFKESLFTMHQKSLDVQKHEIKKILMDWKGELEQVDDILVAGIRV